MSILMSMNLAFNLFNSTHFSLTVLSVAILKLLIIIRFANGNCGSRKLVVKEWRMRFHYPIKAI